VQLFTTTLLFPNVANTHAHAHTHTRTHTRTRTQAHITGLPQGRTRTSAPGPLLLPSPPVDGSPARFELVLSGASSRQVAVIGPGRRSSHKSDRWACSPHVHTAPRRRPPPFLGTRRSCCWPALPNSASLLLRFSSLTRGGNSFPASGVFGPHPHLPSMSHHPMSQFVAWSFWRFPVRSQRVQYLHRAQGTICCECLSSPSAPDPPTNPTTSQIFSCSVPALDHEPDPSMIHPLPLCYLCRGLEVSYPLLSHPRPCRSSGRCVMEEAYCRAFGLGRPAANTDVTLCRRSLGRFLQRLAPWILPNAARLQVLHNILSVFCQSEK
jgi:hypothetical protein